MKLKLSKVKRPTFLRHDCASCNCCCDCRQATLLLSSAPAAFMWRCHFNVCMYKLNNNTLPDLDAVMLTRPQPPMPRPWPRPQPSRPRPRPHTWRPRTQPRFHSIYTGQSIYSEAIFSLQSSLKISQCSVSIIIRPTCN